MKDIRYPFAQSAASIMEAALTDYELKCRHHEDLLMIKNKIENHQMTPELYDFLNLDGSMDKLLPGLPKPTNIACEGLTCLQLDILNSTIAEEANILTSSIMWLWEAIKNWFLDWWDRCRYEKRQLEYIKGKLGISSSIFGTRDSFASTVVSSYSKSEWYDLALGCSSLISGERDIIKSSEDKFNDEVMKVRIASSTSLDRFGKYIDENGIIRQGSPKYTKITRTCVNGGWKYEEIGAYLEKAISILGDDIGIRKEFNDLGNKFKNGDPTNKNSYAFLKRYIYATKEACLHTARSLRLMLNSVRNSAAKSNYKIG